MTSIIYAAWKELDRETFNLRDAIDWVRDYPRQTIVDYPGLFVYVVWRTVGYEAPDVRDGRIEPERNILYVGKTTQSFWTRIHQHMKTGSPIGRLIKQDGWSRFTIDLIEVDRNLDFAERYYIEKLNPLYNTVYNTAHPDILDVADMIED